MDLITIVKTYFVFIILIWILITYIKCKILEYIIEKSIRKAINKTEVKAETNLNKIDMIFAKMNTIISKLDLIDNEIINTNTFNREDYE